MAKKDDLSSIAGLPDELGIDRDLEQSHQRLTVRIDTRRYGKAVTVVAGFDLPASELREVASELKRKLACGGTVHEDTVELQGDHAARVGDVLADMGYEVEA